MHYLIHVILVVNQFHTCIQTFSPQRSLSRSNQRASTAWRELHFPLVFHFLTGNNFDLLPKVLPVSIGPTMDIPTGLLLLLVLSSVISFTSKVPLLKLLATLIFYFQHRRTAPGKPNLVLQMFGCGEDNRCISLALT